MLHVLLEQAGSAHCRNEQTTVAQPAAGPTEGYPFVGTQILRIYDQSTNIKVMCT